MADEIKPLLYSGDEVETILGLGSTKVWELTRDGLLEAVKIGRATRYTSKSVHGLVDNLPRAVFRPKQGLAPAEQRAS